MLYYEGNSLRNLPMYHNYVLTMFCSPYKAVFYCLILRNRIGMLSKTNLMLQLSTGKGLLPCACCFYSILNATFLLDLLISLN